MLSRAQRLSAELLQTIRGAHTVSTPYFSVKTQTSPDHARCAVVVSKKVAKTAVQRNKMRRMVYTHLHNLYSDLLPFYIIIYIRQDLSGLSLLEVREEISNALAKAKVIKVR